jgi:hypothetical protein
MGATGHLEAHFPQLLQISWSAKLDIFEALSGAGVKAVSWRLLNKIDSSG